MVSGDLDWSRLSLEAKAHALFHVPSDAPKPIIHSPWWIRLEKTAEYPHRWTVTFYGDEWILHGPRKGRWFLRGVTPHGTETCELRTQSYEHVFFAAEDYLSERYHKIRNST